MHVLAHLRWRNLWRPPTFWKMYDGSFTDDTRVEQVIDWLKLPPQILNGPVASFYCTSGDSVEKTYQQLKKNSKLDVYRRAQTPVFWHYNENPRSGDLVAIVKGPAVFALDNTTRQGRGPRPPPAGAHGYDPRVFTTMHAIFYAIGPNVVPESKLPHLKT